MHTNNLERKTMNVRPTPETDACSKSIDQSNFEDYWRDDFEEFAWVPADFARKLESERDEARFDLDFRRGLGDWQKKTIDDIAHVRDKAREQRDRLAEALQSVKCELGVPQPEYPSPVANAYWIADEALQSLTTNQP